MIPKFPFTQDALEAVALPEEGKQARVLDAACPGLGLWIGHTGAKVFFAFHWAPGMARPVEAKIGPFPQVTIEQARERVPALVAGLANGEVADARPGTGRLAPSEDDDDALRTPGECKKCLDMTMLNAKGLCGKCRPLPPCAGHPDVTSSGRCSACGQPFCDACMSGRRCAACAAKPSKRRRPGQEAAVADGPRAKGPMAGMAGNRKLLLGAAVGVLVLVQGVMFGLQYLEDQGPAATPEDHYKQRVSIARGGIEAYRAEKKALPADAAALAAFLRANGATPPTLTQPTTPLPKDAVIYVKKDNGFELYATTGE
ncbi:MAG: Arm DNA-binding domain-containing protein, partial [Candidatus Sericytochromatia bacterium]